MSKGVEQLNNYFSRIENFNERIKTDKWFLCDFRKLTRLLFNDKLPKECEECGVKDSHAVLHIHHLKYKFPIEREDLMRLCMSCHSFYHKKIDFDPFLNDEKEGSE
jgi:5-methylcytosine-specific restriction endonuclease McrA